METAKAFPIPARLNLIISATQITILLMLLRVSADASGCRLAMVALGYGLVMNSAYAMLHEAQHGILHPNRQINEITGIVLTLFFPAPFHLARQGHLGHHLRNRSDDEAFDFYFEGESRVWRFLQLYGILTGLFWFVILLGTVAAVLCPGLLRPKPYAFDRRTMAMLGSMNPRQMWMIRLEGCGVLLLHGGLIWWWKIALWHWFATMTGFGVMWSAMQYVHHFGTERDVAKGAANLRIFPLLDWLWLNHHWHLRHHQHPTMPWLYLPRIESSQEAPRRHILSAYLGMWRGPRLTCEHVENRYAGEIIR